ncbi:hypothetical protein TcasGA2_TC011630 [Tribolium castaneum]|uniref:Uncharacterized protein n=1 Tax=Tribolium castaneum TaxID=7070 RepID=D6X101_TRICA|nr:hypothetical protein TcasGA2_TC011630 [Tribolium castaneum]
MEPLPNNSRYILELERNALLQEKFEFDEKYGTFSFAFLTSLEALALLTYIYIAVVLMYHEVTRTKTNLIVSVWAFINFVVLLEKLSRSFGVLLGAEFVISRDVAPLAQMLSGVGRNYGTLLSLVWLFSKYFGTPKPKYDPFLYFFIAVPLLVFSFYVYYYFAVNKFIFEVYGPGCDVVNATCYLLVAFIFVLCKIFVSTYEKCTQYALMISLVNLITNLPICLITIYLRFNLDIAWVYRFHIYFVDFFINAVNCSNAFAVLFLILLYNKALRQSFFMRRNDMKIEPELEKMNVEFC